MCNLSGFEPPEMNKVRPVIVISPRLPYRSQIVSIVPLSTTPPKNEQAFCVQLKENPNPLKSPEVTCWAKCDMLLNISLNRLSGFKIGRRKWETPHLPPSELEQVREGVLHALGFGGLIKEKF